MASADKSLSIGSKSVASKRSAIAIGAATASATQAIAIGAPRDRPSIGIVETSALGSYSVAIGNGAKAEGSESVALGTLSIASASQFKINIYRIDSPGASWGQNLKVDWIAWN